MISSITSNSILYYEQKKILLQKRKQVPPCCIVGFNVQGGHWSQLFFQCYRRHALMDSISRGFPPAHMVYWTTQWQINSSLGPFGIVVYPALLGQISVRHSYTMSRVRHVLCPQTLCMLSLAVWGYSIVQTFIFTQQVSRKCNVVGTVQIFILLFFYICFTNSVTICLDLTIGTEHLESKAHGDLNNPRRKFQKAELIRVICFGSLSLGWVVVVLWDIDYRNFESLSTTNGKNRPLNKNFNVSENRSDRL